MSVYNPISKYDNKTSPNKNRQLCTKSTERKVYSTDKSVSRRQHQKGKGEEDSKLTMGDKGQCKIRDLDNDRNSDSDKNSETYYSDDYDNTTYGSERSPTPSSKGRSPGIRKKTPKTIRSTTPLHNQGIRKVSSKQPLSKRGERCGFRSQSLNKDPPLKDIDLVAKRVLSARLLKINELRNEVTEMQIRQEELQKENKALRRMQCRQEKALNKFEDTESEISQLISRHNNEIRVLRERLRKSLDQERITERKLKETEEELYRTNCSLQKLKKLSEDRQLGEREALAQKLLAAEIKLDDREKKVKDLEKNLELSQSSFQRHLLSERKKAREAAEESKALQEEILQLCQKLKEKERELDVKNIYAFRLSKPSPKKDTDITPRKKASHLNITSRSVQTTDPFPQADFPPPPPFVLNDDTEQKERDKRLRMEKEILEQKRRQQTELLRQEQEWLERNRENEERMKKDQEQKILEEKAQKLREEWEMEEFERKVKENNLLLEKIAREERFKTEADAYKIETERQNLEKMEEERRKKELLAKMKEIDKEKQNVFYPGALVIRNNPQTQHLDTSAQPDSTEKKPKTYTFSEPTQKLFNGVPVQGKLESTSKAEGQGRRINKKTDFNADLAFGGYAPSFGKVTERSCVANQKSGVLEDAGVNNMDFGLPKEKEKKSNLLEQLFGANLSPTHISKTEDPKNAVADNLKVTNGASGGLPWEHASKTKAKDGRLHFTEVKTVNSNRPRLQHTTGRPAVRAINSIEDEIEEVAL